jgi:hypothetical protein
MLDRNAVLTGLEVSCSLWCSVFVLQANVECSILVSDCAGLRPSLVLFEHFQSDYHTAVSFWQDSHELNNTGISNHETYVYYDNGKTGLGTKMKLGFGGPEPVWAD